MIIARIHNATRVIGQRQGYLGLPLRDEIRNTTVDGEHTPVMVTAWEPTFPGTPCKMRDRNGGKWKNVRPHVERVQAWEKRAK